MEIVWLPSEEITWLLSVKFCILAHIMKAQGIRRPIVVSKRSDLITIGHGRLEAAKLNGWKAYPVDFQEYESEAMEYADMVADNKIAELSEVDMAMVNEDFVQFGPDFDVDLLGIPGFEIEPFDALGKKDEESLPGLPREPKTRLGDLYILGKHRLLCGDSTNIQHVKRLMSGETATITFTSPPYNAGRFGYDGGKDKYKGKADDVTEEQYFDFLVSFTDIALKVSNLVFFNNQFLSGNRHALGRFFGHYHQMIKEVFPWIKNTAPPNVNKGVFTNRFEFILCLEPNNLKKGFPVNWQGQYHNIIEGHTAAKENVTEGTHSATMPLYVIEWFIERLPFIETIFDPFGGSGSTLIASEKAKRQCRVMELDPKYCDVIVERWEICTGKKAKLLRGKS